MKTMLCASPSLADTLEASLAYAYVNEMLGAEVQGKISAPTYALPTNKSVPPPAGMPTNATIHSIDWAYVADNRNDWVKRWDRDMAI